MRQFRPFRTRIFFRVARMAAKPRSEAYHAGAIWRSLNFQVYIQVVASIEPFNQLTWMIRLNI